VTANPLASLPWITPISNTGRPVGSPKRYAVMSRPCTDCPITRSSVISGAGTVEVDEVDVEVEVEVVVDVVVLDDVEVVDGVVVVVVVVAATEVAVVVDTAAVLDSVSGSDEHARSTCDATRSAHHPKHRVTDDSRSRERDKYAAVAVRDPLALDDATDLVQELRDLGHESVLRNDLRTDAFELRAGDQFCRRLDRGRAGLDLAPSVRRLHDHLARVSEALGLAGTGRRPEPDLVVVDRRRPDRGRDRSPVALERRQCQILLIPKTHGHETTGMAPTGSAAPAGRVARQQNTSIKHGADWFRHQYLWASVRPELLRLVKRGTK
jgi:hypothetical protein